MAKNRNSNTILSKINRETSRLTLVSIVCISIVAFWGISYMRQNISETSGQLGHNAAEESKAALEEQTQDALVRLVGNKATIANEKFRAVRTNVEMVRRTASEIMSHPENYAARTPEFPSAANAGVVVSQMMLGDDVAMADVAAEAALIGNLQDALNAVRLTSDSIESVYIGTESGIAISSDTASDKKTNTYEPRTRPWYKDAKAAGAPIWTDVFSDSSGRGLAITCAAPYVDASNTIRGVVGAGMLLDHLNEIVLGTKIGASGYAYIVNQQGHVLMSDSAGPSSDAVSLLTDPVFGTVTQNMVEGKSGIERIQVDGVGKFVAYHPLEAVSWSLATVMDVDEAIAPALQSEQNITDATVNALTQIDQIIKGIILAFGLAFLVEFALKSSLTKRLAKTLSDPIVELSEGAKKIGAGDLDYVLNVKTGDELETLSDTFNTMIADIKSITSEKERIGAELNVATQIQASMLPAIFPPYPESPEFDLYASMLPAKEVGGDFYDFFLLDKHRIAIVIADVSGKGIPAALFMVIAKTLIKNNAFNDISPKEVFEIVNNLLCENNDAGMFVTAFMGIADIKNNQFTYVNAGHNPPLIRHKDGAFEWLPTTPCFILGGMDDMVYTQDSVPLATGDEFYLYTDGVTEAVDPALTLYGEDRLLSVANEHKDKSLKDLLIAIKQDIDAFADGAEQADDITMLAMRIIGGIE